MYGLWAILSALLRCIPVAKSWRPESPGFCLSNDILWLANAGVYIVTDLVIAVMPLIEMLSLHVLPLQAAAWWIVFALGRLYVLVAILQTVSCVTTDSPSQRPRH